MSAELRLELPDSVVERIAERAAELVLARLNRDVVTADVSPFLSAVEAAELMRCSRQRVYDLVSSGRLPGRKDGARLLIERAEVLRHLGGEPV